MVSPYRFDGGDSVGKGRQAGLGAGEKVVDVQDLMEEAEG